jgi:hypothetical protein
MRVEDPQLQKITGKTDPVEVMAELRAMYGSQTQAGREHSLIFRRKDRS